MYWAFHIYWTLMSIGALYATYVRLKSFCSSQQPIC